MLDFDILFRGVDVDAWQMTGIKLIGQAVVDYLLAVKLGAYNPETGACKTVKKLYGKRQRPKVLMCASDARSAVEFLETDLFERTIAVFGLKMDANFWREKLKIKHT